MILQIVLVVVILIGLLLAYAATRPNTFHVERSAPIAAQPEAIAPLILDFHKWRQWSPWEGRDPALKREFSGAAAGNGAIYNWKGNKNVGEGRMEIIDAQPTRITIKLDFLKPFEAHNKASFMLQPAGEFTNVTWAVDGPSNLMHKLMCLFINMDKTIGKDFEAGLATLKKESEAR